MERRLKLHEKLCDILGSDHVYFQPPATICVQYPCIIYERVGADSTNADDKHYVIHWEYRLLVIDRDPESAIPSNLLKSFQQCRAGRFYTADNLNHYPFTLYY